MSDPRPTHFGIIDQEAMRKLSVFPPTDQFKILLREYIDSSPFNHRIMRAALGHWMRETLSSIDPELCYPPTPADELVSRRSYWRRYYQLNRERLNATRRAHYRQRHRQDFGIQ